MDLSKYRKDPVLEMEEGVLGMSQRTVEKTLTDIWQTPRKPEPHNQLLSPFSDKRHHEKSQKAIAVELSSKSGQARGETVSLSVSNPSSCKLFEDRSQMMQKSSTIFKKDIGEKIVTSSQPPHKTGSATTREYKFVEKHPWNKLHVKTRLDMTSEKNVVSHPVAIDNKSTMSCDKLVRSKKMTTLVVQEESVDQSSGRFLKDEKTTSINFKKDIGEKIATASQPQQKTGSSATKEYKSVEKEPLNKLQVKTRLHIASEKKVVSLPGARSSKLTMSCDRLPQSKKMTTVIIKEELVDMPRGETKLDLSKEMDILEMKTQKKAAHKPKSSKEGRSDVRVESCQVALEGFMQDRERLHLGVTKLDLSKEMDILEKKTEKRAAHKPKSTNERMLDARIESCQVALEGYMQGRERLHLDIESGRLSSQEVHEYLKMKRWNLAVSILKEVGLLLLDVVWKSLITGCCFAIAYRTEMVPTHFVDTLGFPVIACIILFCVVMIKFFVHFWKTDIMKLPD